MRRALLGILAMGIAVFAGAGTAAASSVLWVWLLQSLSPSLPYRFAVLLGMLLGLVFLQVAAAFAGAWCGEALARRWRVLVPGETPHRAGWMRVGIEALAYVLGVAIGVGPACALAFLAIATALRFGGTSTAVLGVLTSVAFVGAPTLGILVVRAVRRGLRLRPGTVAPPGPAAAGSVAAQGTGPDDTGDLRADTGVLTATA